MTIMYKIRYKDNPTQYITGTPYYQSSNKDGRIFPTLGKLRTFLTGVMKVDADGDRNRVANWEVIELEMVEKDVKDIHEIITAKKLKELIMK